MNKFIKKISKIFLINSRLSKIALGDVISGLLGGIFWLLLPSIMIPEEFGEIAYLVSIAGFTSNLVLVGSYNSILVLSAKNVRIESTLSLISIIIGSISAGIIIFVTNRIEIITLIFAYIFTNLIIPEFLGKKQSGKYLSYSIVNKLVVISCSLVLFYFLGPIGIILGLSTSVIIFGKNIFLNLNKIKIDFKLLNSNRKFILSNFIIDIASSISGSLDKIIIVPILGFTALAGYYLGMQFFALLIVIPNIVFKLTLSDDASGIPNIKLKIKTFVLMTILVIVSILLVPHFISAFYSEYVDFIFSIKIILIAIIPGTINLLLLSNLLGKEKNKINITFSWLYAGTMILMILLLGETYGEIGIAFSFLIAQSTACLFLGISKILIRN